MKLSEKILKLRKENGMSQEDLAEKLKVSRQAVSRWESGTVLPDSSNVLQLSKLFGVTTDYLLNEDYESNQDILRVQIVQPKLRMTDLHLPFILSVAFQFMCFSYQLIVGLMAKQMRLSLYFTMASVLGIILFQIAYRRNKLGAENTFKHYKRFHNAAIWMNLYFPIRWLMCVVADYFPRLLFGDIFEIVSIVVYVLTSILVIRIIRSIHTEQSDMEPTG